MATALDYHEATKHRFDRFARSRGRLDWATQPDPFRRYNGAPVVSLPHEATTGSPAAVGVPAIGELLRCSLGLSAWKSYGASRWALRVNPSSGNLHPTEGYVVWGREVFHYAPDRHVLERRAVLGADTSATDDGLLVGLSSIHWREAWKYGERAYRYCQHDVGHALGALRFAAALLGWHLTILDEWPDAAVAAVLGLDRDDDFRDAERETPACIALVSTRPGLASADVPRLVEAARQARWEGAANRLSPARVEWPIIDEVSAAASYDGRPIDRDRRVPSQRSPDRPHGFPRDVILRRRSALGFDPRRHLPLESFLTMLRHTRPDGVRVPWDVVDWTPVVHLVLFVHRVEGLVPGVYVSLRDTRAKDELQAAMRAEFLWEPAHDLFLLLPSDVTWAARRLSCDQDIAADGFFGVTMLSRFEPVLAKQGDWMYRRMFWECGLIGQVLYLEAEAAGGRGTGIGCFYDDPVHDTLGLTGYAWQCLYHFAMGAPVEDTRLTTEPGYPWEARPRTA